VADPALEARALRKDFGSKVAVRDLTLSVPRGEVFGFLGPNGAGKTTSIKMLLGLVHPTSGGGRLLGAPMGTTRARARVGYLPEHFAFHEWLRGRELLRFHGRLLGLRGPSLEQALERLLRRVELAEAGDQCLREYSKGMRQRIGLAQALLGEPDLVFLDEPTSGLDPLGRLLVRDVIRDLKARGTTVFLNSHLLSEVEVTCDRVAFVKSGQVVREMTLGAAERDLEVELRLDHVSPVVLEGLARFGGDVREEDGRIRLRVEGEERLPGGGGVRAVLTIAHLTLAEARRRRILAAALLLGAAFVLLFGVGFHFIARDIRAHGSPAQQRFMMSFVVMAALYASNFLIVMTSVLVTVDTLAGEIGSGVIETLCTKPVPRFAVALGKWLGCWTILALYATLLCGGVLVVARLVGGYTPPNAARGLPLLLLEGTVLLTLALAGGTRLSTLANGVTVFGLYGLAFVGGWMEQIGTLASNATARYIGIGASLLVPSESLWQLASHHMQPAIVRDLGIGPFSPVSVPSPAMVGWAGGYVLLTLAVALRLFRTRDL
jgi:ABC-2 type transport system ATP-binding protein